MAENPKNTGQNGGDLQPDSPAVAKKYRVKPDRLVIHGGETFLPGAELWLVDAVAAVHGENLELIPSPPGETPPPIASEPEEPTPPEAEEAIAILEEVATPKKNAAK